MSRNLSISETGLKLIKAFEGFRPVDRLLVTGVRVVGYGHRLYNDRPVNMSREDAETQLVEDLKPFEELVNEEVLAPLSQSQFDALCSLAFNIGPKAFRTSDIVRALNNGRPLDAANGFDVWRTSTINGQTYVIDALMRRRTAEKSLFLRTDYLPQAPTALVPPRLDENFPNVGTGDGLPVYSHADPDGTAETVPYAVDDAAQSTPARQEQTNPPMPQPGRQGVTLSQVLDLDDDDATSAGETETLSDTTDDLDTVMSLPDGPQLDSADETNPSVTVDAPHDDETTVSDDQPSAIAEAAGQLRQRLDNLIDQSGDDQPVASKKADEKWPTSMFNADSDDDETKSDETSQGKEPAKTRASDARSNLLAFPGATRSRPIPVQSDPKTQADVPFAEDAPSVVRASRGSAAPVESTVQSRSVPNGSADILIDELEADDRLRGQYKPTLDDAQDPNGEEMMDVFSFPQDDDVEGDPATGLWIPILVGFALLGASIAAGLRGAQSLMGDWGPIAVVAGIITGTLMIAFSIYISLTQKS